MRVKRRNSTYGLVAALCLGLVSACGGGSSGASQAAFCNYAKSHPGSSSDGLTKYTKSFDELIAKAPSDIKGDVETVAPIMEAAVKNESLPDMTSAKNKAAFTRFTAYLKNKCHYDIQNDS